MMKKCFAVALTIAAAFAFANNTQAAPVSATYDSGTGNIVIDVNNVVNWYIEQEGGMAMTGAAPVGLNPANGLITDNDVRIGQSGFAAFSYPGLDLGPVAATGLADDGTLKIFWNDFLGAPTEMTEIDFGTMVTPPTAAIGHNRPTSPTPWDALLDPTIDFNTTGTTGDPTLTYEWDYDYDGVTFVPNGETGSSASIADVYATVGPNGTYTAAVRVSNAGGSDIATIDYTYIPEPTTFALAGMGLMGLIASRRRR